MLAPSHAIGVGFAGEGTCGHVELL
uniref:Uncharacterized protein n=1 Tax=Arundo donax TaxID=35708 RepID=A0A0A9SFL6_ARUDO